MRKSQTTTNIFLLLLLYKKNSYFVRKHLKKRYIVTFVLQFSRVTGYWKCNNKTATPMQMYIDFVDVVLQPRSNGIRLGDNL